MAKLNLNNPIWNTEARRRRLSVLVQASAAELEGEIKKTILDSTPAGRTYRRGAITAPFSKRRAALGLKTRITKNGNKRLIVGSRFHRASLPGQAPAVDSGALLNSTRAQKISDLKAKVSVGKKYAAALDSGTTRAGRNKRTTIKPRPFFKVTVEKFRPRFKVKISEVLTGK